MEFIDVHCHIDCMKNIEKIIKNAEKNKVNTIINNGINIKTNRKTLELSKKYPEIKPALGIYPIEALKLSEKEIKNEIKFIEKNKNKIIAIGEVGIDLKWNKEFEKQKIIFEKFIDLSKKINKPLIVHARSAEKEVIKILKEKNCKKIVMHCFNGNLRLVEEIIKQNWFLSIPANITFSEHFQKVVEKTPIENLLCETDSPYLHPIKGKRNNEPMNVIESYKKIAEIKKLSLKQIQEKIKNNFKKLFR